MIAETKGIIYIWFAFLFIATVATSDTLPNIEYNDPSRFIEDHKLIQKAQLIIQDSEKTKNELCQLKARIMSDSCTYELQHILNQK